jgi:hypothetical protein
VKPDLTQYITIFTIEVAEMFNCFDGFPDVRMVNVDDSIWFYGMFSYH